MKAWRNNQILILLLLCGAMFACWLPRLSGPIDLRWDAAAYYILGTSLAEGKGYRLLSEPGEIWTTLHPPLLPALVAAHQVALQTTDYVIVGRCLRATFLVVSLVYIVAIYCLFKQFLFSFSAFSASLICLLQTNTQVLSDLLFAELLFGLTSVFFYIFHRKYDKKGQGFLAIIPAFFSYALRTVGIALFAAWVGESLLKKQFKTAVLRAALCLLPILAWQTYVYRVETSEQYNAPAYEYQRADYMYPNVSYVRNTALVDSFVPEKGYITARGRIERFARNALVVPTNLGEAVSAPRGYFEWVLMIPLNALQIYPSKQTISHFVFFVLLVLGLLVIGGAILLAKRREWLIPLYISASITLMCLTPWSHNFSRYLMPLTPFLILCLFEALIFIKKHLSKVLLPGQQFVGTAFSALVVSSILFVQVMALYLFYQNDLLPIAYNDRNGQKVEYSQFYYYKPFQSLDEGLDWLMVNGKPGGVVAGTWPHWIYLRTGFKAVLPPFEQDAEKAQLLLDTVPVQYLLLEKDLASGKQTLLGAARYLTPLVQNPAGYWKLIYSTPDGNLEIYERQN